VGEKEITITFQPSGRTGRVKQGKNVLQAAEALGEAIPSICGGKQTCGKCKVKISGPISLFSPEEGDFISEREREAGYRLACATQVLGDIEITIPPESRGIASVVRKSYRPGSISLNPAIRVYALALHPPNLGKAVGDFERLQQRLTDAFGLRRDLSIDPTVLHSLPQTIRTDSGKIQVFVWMDKKILDVRPGMIGECYGLAIDIGTTTVAVYLCRLGNGQIVAMDAMVNPQAKYGEDVMSRITYAMTNPETGLRDMQTAIVEGLNHLILSLCRSAQIVAANILEASVVGNTAMHHIFLGIDPQNLGRSPFSPAIQSSLDIPARDLGLKIHPAANIHVLPIEAGFVGADNVGVLIAERPYEQEEVVLIIDAGTNGELILGNHRRLLSSSCATGPAFEGAHLQFGMRAAIGAIEKVRLDPGSLDVKFKVIGLEKWSDDCSPEEIQARGICGSGIIDAVAEMFAAGVLEKSGRFNPALRHPHLRKSEKGYAFVIAHAEQTAMGRDITVCAADIREVQLAKGAIYAGAKVMMKILGVEKVDRVILAGGFGSMLDSARALRLGMFPDCDLEKVVSVGNAAGEGARIALLDRDKRREAESIARRIEYVELTTSPDFTREFMEAMPFPHSKDFFPHSPRMPKPQD
jgi:uncharacterized 2Fe-2S/4Fe-4S cluster protein (DUF4445 family)